MITLPASSRSLRGSHPRVAAHQRPSGRSHSARNDRSTITSPTTTTRSRTQISPGIHGAIPDPTRHNRSPPQALTRARVQISTSAGSSCSRRRSLGACPGHLGRARPQGRVASCFRESSGTAAQASGGAARCSRERQHCEARPARGAECWASQRGHSAPSGSVTTRSADEGTVRRSAARRGSGPRTATDGPYRPMEFGQGCRLFQRPACPVSLKRPQQLPPRRPPRGGSGARTWLSAPVEDEPSAG